jgi:hypothetical protein
MPYARSFVATVLVLTLVLGTGWCPCGEVPAPGATTAAHHEHLPDEPDAPCHGAECANACVSVAAPGVPAQAAFTTDPAQWHPAAGGVPAALPPPGRNATPDRPPPVLALRSPGTPVSRFERMLA